MPRIVTTFAADETQMDAAFSRQTTKANAFGQKMRSITSNIFSSKSAAESGGTFKKFFDLKDSIAQTQRDRAFNEAGPVGKIKLVTSELATLARQRATVEKGTTAELELQLAIEQKLTSLRGLQRTKQAADAAQVKLPAGGGEQDNIFTKILGRKFSLGDAFKDSLKSLGVGGVGAAATVISDIFSRQATDATREANKSRSIADTMVDAGATGRGLEAQLAATNNKASARAREIAITRQTVDEMSGNPLNLVGQGKDELAAQKDLLAQLEIEQAQLEAQAKALTKEINEQNEALRLQADIEKRLAAARARGANEGEIASIERDRANAQLVLARNNNKGALAIKAAEQAEAEAKNRQKQISRDNSLESAQFKNRVALQKELNRLRQDSSTRPLQIAKAELDAAQKNAEIIRKMRPNDDAANRAARLAVLEAQGNYDSAVASERRGVQSTRVSIGDVVAGRAAGKRGLTETERIAQRGAEYQRQYEEAVVSGQSRAATYYSQLAARDLATVGRRVEATAKDVPKDLGLSSPLYGAAQELKAAAKALSTVELTVTTT